MDEHVMLDVDRREFAIAKKNVFKLAKDFEMRLNLGAYLSTGLD